MNSLNKKITISSILILILIIFATKTSFSLEETSYLNEEDSVLFIENCYIEVEDFDKEYNFTISSTKDVYYNLYIEYYDNDDISYSYKLNNNEYSNYIKISNNKYLIQNSFINKDTVDSINIKFKGNSKLIIKFNVEYHENPDYLIDNNILNKYLIFDDKLYYIKDIINKNIDNNDYKLIKITGNYSNDPDEYFDNLDPMYQDMILEDIVIENNEMEICLRNDISIISGTGSNIDPYIIKLLYPKEFQIFD